MYTIEGYSGTYYNDPQRWEVISFKSLEEAERFKEELETWIEENKENYIDCPFDSKFKDNNNWETGVKYEIILPTEIVA